MFLQQRKHSKNLTKKVILFSIFTMGTIFSGAAFSADEEEEDPGETIVIICEVECEQDYITPGGGGGGPPPPPPEEEEETREECLAKSELDFVKCTTISLTKKLEGYRACAFIPPFPSSAALPPQDNTPKGSYYDSCIASIDVMFARDMSECTEGKLTRNIACPSE